MIIMTFVLREAFKHMGLPYIDIPVSKSKGTLRFYEQYWNEINSIIGDGIKKIIER